MSVLASSSRPNLHSPVRSGGAWRAEGRGGEDWGAGEMGRGLVYDSNLGRAYFGTMFLPRCVV